MMEAGRGTADGAAGPPRPLKLSHLRSRFDWGLRVVIGAAAIIAFVPPLRTMPIAATVLLKAPVAIVAAALLVRTSRLSITVDKEVVTVRNPFRTTRLQVADVERVELSLSKLSPGVKLHLRDQQVISVSALTPLIGTMAPGAFSDSELARLSAHVARLCRAIGRDAPQRP